MATAIIMFFMLGLAIGIIGLRAKAQIEAANQQKFWLEAKPLLKRKIMIEYHTRQVSDKEEAIELLNEFVKLEEEINELKQKYNVKL